MALRGFCAALLLGFHITATSAASKLPPGVVSLPLSRIINDTFYGVQFEAGTPGQRNVLKLDTGSDTIGLMTPHSNLCLRVDKPCAELGTYNNKTSSTVINAYPDAGDYAYSDDLIDHGHGVFENDTIRFSDVTLKQFLFGALDGFDATYYIQPPAAGILGMGLLCEPGEGCDAYPTFVQQLAQRGVLKKPAYSIYLGPDDPDTVGHLLLGGVDRAKQGGPVVTMPLFVYDSFSNFVNYTSMALVDKKDNCRQKFQIKKGSASQWDTGTWTWPLPEAAYNATIPKLGLTPGKTGHASPIPVDCKYRDVKDEVLEVGFPGGHTIDVPIGRLVSKLPDGSCGTYLESVAGEGGLPGPGNAFGALFLRSVYFTFDFDDMTVSFSQVKYTEEEDIHAI